MADETRGWEVNVPSSLHPVTLWESWPAQAHADAKLGSQAAGGAPECDMDQLQSAWPLTKLVWACRLAASKQC